MKSHVFIKLVPICICGIFMQQSFAQAPVKNTKFQIDYVYSSGIKQSIKMEDSITFVTIDENGDSTRSRIRNEHRTSNPKKIELKYFVRGDKYSSEIFLKNAMTDGSNFPNKLQYKNKHWYSGSGEELKKIVVEYVDVVYTKQYKNILGYKCEKVTGSLKESNQRFEIWVCDKLPNTLMPASGLRPLKGAILEWNFPNNESYFRSVAVKKV